ncbi:hypothetical protein [Yinghuangia seranimata]|uniref:hypothetical protein n=1 Tax=Yinghuangia seranimata TaxID=408067 RepID=UPI00248C7870|nr:hypothetical protein [Yinghuangia seranimata]MDI2128854.1 hypothetical protein [Yinghuangia seranimata]
MTRPSAVPGEPAHAARRPNRATADGFPALHTLMAESTEGLPPLPDLVPAAIVDGLRRRRKRRATLLATAAAAAAAAAMAVPALLSVFPEGASATPPGRAATTYAAVPWLPELPTLTALPTPYPTAAPTAGTSWANRSSGEQLRQQELFQQMVADVLHKALPDADNTVEIVHGQFLQFVVTLHGKRYGLDVSMTPTSPWTLTTLPACTPKGVDPAGRPYTCTTGVLRNGQAVFVRHTEGTPTTANVYYGGALLTIRDLRLSTASTDALPLTDAERIALISTPELLQLAQYLVTHHLAPGDPQAARS